MPPAGESSEVELISAELARSQVASVLFGVRTSLGRIVETLIGRVVNNHMILGVTRRGRRRRHIAPGGCRRGYKTLILGFRMFLPRLNSVKTSIFTASEEGWGRASGIG